MRGSVMSTNPRVCLSYPICKAEGFLFTINKAHIILTRIGNHPFMQLHIFIFKYSLEYSDWRNYRCRFIILKEVKDQET